MAGRYGCHDGNGLFVEVSDPILKMCNTVGHISRYRGLVVCIFAILLAVSCADVVSGESTTGDWIVVSIASDGISARIFSDNRIAVCDRWHTDIVLLLGSATERGRNMADSYGRIGCVALFAAATTR